MVRSKLIILCSLLFVITAVPLLGLPIVGSSSEARELHIAHIISQSGEWLLPRRGGILPSKPPLFHWVAAMIGVPLSGVDPWIGRFVSAIFACGYLILTLVILRLALAGSNHLKKFSNLGLALASLILVTTYGFSRMAVEARVDMACAFFILLALFAIYSPFVRSSTGLAKGNLPLQRKDLTLFFIASALAVLTKGPIGFVLPVVISAAFLWWWTGFSVIKKLFSLSFPGVLLFLLIVVPWYFFAWQHGGEEFVSKQLFFENLKRVYGGDFVNERPAWYYLPAFVSKAAPWSLLFIILLWRSFKNRKEIKFINITTDNITLAFCFIWVIAGIAFLSLSAGKRASYLLPLYGGVSVALSIWTVRIVSKLSDLGLRKLKFSLSKLEWSTVSIFGLCIILIFTGPFISRFGSTELKLSLEWLNSVSSTSMLYLCFVLLVWICYRLKDTVGLYGTAFRCFLLLAGIMFFSLNVGYGVKYHLKGFTRVAAQVDKLLPEESELVVYRYKHDELLDPLLYYLRKDFAVQLYENGVEACTDYALVSQNELGIIKGKGINLTVISELKLVREEAVRDRY